MSCSRGPWQIFSRLNVFMRRQRGAGAVEVIIGLAALLPVAFGVVQVGLIYEAKSLLENATFEAARAGAVSHAKKTPMREALARNLVPLYGGGSTVGELGTSYGKAWLDTIRPAILNGAGAKITILNPTKAAFDDFDDPNTDVVEIPNDHLKYRDRSVGPTSGVNIQDANLLKIKITYGYRLYVPLVNKLIAKTLTFLDPEDAAYYQADPPRLPITAVATVRMHTPARHHDETADESEGGGGGTVPEETESGEAAPDAVENNGNNDNNGNPTGNTSDSGSNNHGATELGTSVGANNRRQPSTNVNGASNTNGNNEAEATENDDANEVECESSYHKNEEGFVNRFLGWMRDAVSFADGVIEGLKQQGIDLFKAVTNPKETINGLKALGEAFIDDPAGTAEMVAKALGEDVTRLLACGPYDQGRIIGEYVSPVFMAKVGTKLAQFGDLAKAIEKTADELGTNKVKDKDKNVECASFAAGTPVWTATGPVAIEALLQGQAVQTRSDQTFGDQTQAITKTFGRVAPDYHKLRTEFETLAVTAEHPFYVQGQGWTRAADIGRGDAIVSANGDALVYSNEHVEEEVRVYNFSVAKTHSYWVGESGLWAHNAGGDGVVCDLAGEGAVAKKTFPNKMPETLADEIAIASSVGAKPLRYGDKDFEAAVNSGTVKFVVTQSGEVLISPHTVNAVEISHAALSNGKSVLAAGQADIAASGGRFYGIGITNHSGHYQPSIESLSVARESFKELGIVFP